ncbi:MAG: hypothetical protein PHE73_05620 [Sulfurovaceae bacterium]|jgi:hypothetical protein|nr:hypothetical protein [Sulfurovaceae bacterium]
MVSLSHLETALAAIDAQIKALQYDETIIQSEKEQKIISLMSENKILKRAYQDLCNLKEKSQHNSTTDRHKK